MPLDALLHRCCRDRAHVVHGAIMKWGDFKKLVESSGVTDDDIIGYMDFSGVRPYVDRAHNGDVEVWD